MSRGRVEGEGLREAGLRPGRLGKFGGRDDADERAMRDGKGG